MTATTLPERRRGVRGFLGDIYHERTHFQFIERSWRWALLSGALIVIAVAALGLKGLNLGIDFEGGTQWQFTVSKGSASASDVRDALKGTGIVDPKVLVLGNDGIRVQAEELKSADRTKVIDALAKYGGIKATDVSVTDVGPTWGDQVSNKALTALAFFFVLVALYLTFRFEWRMALAAIIAVVHDIILTVGVYAVTGFEVTPGTVVAFLTILGFSLYDTVVVFDKIKENTPTVGSERGDTYSRHGEPLDEPGPDAVAQHVVRRAAARCVALVRRERHPRCDHAARLRAGVVRRPDDRCVLVDLRRDADPGQAQGARASLRRAA